MRIEIQNLLNSDLSSNYIATQTNVSQAVISKLRNCKREIGNLSLDSAEKLYNYEMERMAMKKINDFYNFMNENFKLIKEEEGIKEYDLNDTYFCRVVDFGTDLDIDIFYKKQGKTAEEFSIESTDSESKIDFVEKMIIGKSKM